MLEPHTGSDPNPLPHPAEPEFLQARQAAHEERTKRWRSSRHILSSIAPGPDAIMINGNDYLGLARHPRLVEAEVEALRRDGQGVLVSGVFLHGKEPQPALEERLADFLRAETTVLCQSGYNANVGLLMCIADKDVPVYTDRRAHMSLWDGIRGAGATAVPFRHNDVAHLKEQIRAHGPGVIVVDSVYSSDGSVCPLTQVADLAAQEGCVLVVDESHSLGTHGPRGAGMVVELGLLDRVHFRTASLGKAFVSRSGLITCTKRFAPYFKMRSGPAVFSVTLVPQDIAGLDVALTLVQEGDVRRARLHANARFLRHELASMGYDLHGCASQIISLESGLEPRTVTFRDALQKRGIFGSVFCAPATSPDRALIRFSMHSRLTAEQLVRIVRACRDIREEVDADHWGLPPRPPPAHPS
ncbi:alpha-hydroxyketone-type quorum-sensing autoinducer synthase [Corallococcus terminator]|uniref:Quorum-sensing autoinducer synthase n=1 Tax=Corallococcus terminator TaxID=2316733 RepID=A0A3A8J5T5_9BACT|nr:alpha-hydroxyketone-type quorum-sensing autoinducer synthase [Corallococcus terminator]RKG90368.1 quorum-sensing autoinducer synthase [Corallococcus terminator]